MATTHKWVFRSRFRRNAFGWRSQPAVQRVGEAVTEIANVARQDPVLAAEGAVLFIERVAAALEHVDSSSGAIGAAVNSAIASLVHIISTAPAPDKAREKWLERLFAAHEADKMPYIENLADYWGELCASPMLATQWADRLIGTTRMALSKDKSSRGHFHGTDACLSSLHAAGRFDEILDIVREETFWDYKRWGVRALVAQGKPRQALELAEASRSPWANDFSIDCTCEEILLSSGRVDDAYQKYGLRASRAGTYVAWFRAVAKKYPRKQPTEILDDLVAETPGEEGKWFATAKALKLFDKAIELANRTPCSPQTLTRAARDFAVKQPSFALEAGMAALRWLVEGHGYNVTGMDVLQAYTYTLQAAENANTVENTKQRIRELVASEAQADRFVTKVLSDHLGFI